MIDRRALLTTLAGAALMPMAAQAQAKIVRVPIRLLPSGRPAVQLTIDGKGPYTFMIDTGSGMALIKADLAMQMGLLSTREVRLDSVKGWNDCKVYPIKNMILGGALRVPDFEMAGFETMPDEGVDGVLPVDFLTLLPSQLDFVAGEIRYYLGVAMDLDGFTEVNAVYHADNHEDAAKVYLEIRVAGTKILCLADTGATWGVAVLSHSVDSHKWWDAFPLLREEHTIGANGERTLARLVAADNVTIGTVPISRIAMLLNDPHERQASAMPYDGVVGMPFLHAFTLAFAPGKRLFLKPNGLIKGLAMPPPEAPAP